MASGGFHPAPRGARHGAGDWDDEDEDLDGDADACNHPPPANEDSYQGPPVAGFDDSRGDGVAGFRAGATFKPGQPLDFGFLMPPAGATGSAPCGSSDSMASDEDRKGASIGAVRTKRSRCDSMDVSQNPPRLEPPRPPRRPHRVPFGVVDGEDRGPKAMDPPIFRTDPFHWMRDPSHEDQEVQALLKDEDAYCNRCLSHLRDLRERLYAEMMARTEEDDVDLPVPDPDGHAYYSRSFKGKPYKAHFRAKVAAGPGCPCQPEAKGAPVTGAVATHAAVLGLSLVGEELLLDENELSLDEDGSVHPYCSIHGPELSYDSELLAYAADFKGDDCCAIRFRRRGCSSREDDPADELENTSGCIEWDAAGHAGMYYVALDSEFRCDSIRRHVLGTPQSQDLVLLREEDKSFSVSIERTSDLRLLVLSSCSSHTSERWLLDLHRPSSGLRCVCKRQEGHMYQVDHTGGFLYVLTNKDGARNSKLCRLPVTSLDGRGGVAQMQDVWVPGPRVKLDSLHCFESFIVIEGRDDSVRRLFVIHYASIGAAAPPAVETVVLPEAQLHDGTLLTPRRRLAAVSLYSVGLHSNSLSKTDIIRVYRSDFCCPSRVYSYHVPTKSFKMLKEDASPNFDRSLYRAERITSHRRQVPISLVYRTDCRPNGLKGGPFPTLLTGYGCYGACSDPDFDFTLLSLLDRGVVYAIGHVRGGGELGEEWWEEGRQFNVKNRFLDFEAVAETLIEEGISEASRLVAWGESSGGCLITATANMRPDLFKALLLEVPFCDALNTMSDPTIPLTCGDWAEYNNTNEREAFNYLLEYSPYDNIRMQEYPAVLCTGALNDAMVGYWEPLKYITKLRHMKLDENLALMKVNFHAGHGHSSDRYEDLREKSFMFAFVLNQMGIDK